MNFTENSFVNSFFYLFKWLVISSLIGVLVGSASAGFLWSLDLVTIYREDHKQIMWFLPLAGLAIASLYKYLGKEVAPGNNLLIVTIHTPGKIIPLRMAPYIYVGTIVTHLFGGSAGREGTALQMAASIVDQAFKVFKFNKEDRHILLIAAVSAGFGSVFGTPLAAAIFGLEFFRIGKISYKAILPAFLSGIAADQIVRLWEISHTVYDVGLVPTFSIPNAILAIVAGIIFGLCARFFSSVLHNLTLFFKTQVKYELLRPIIGGSIIATSVYFLNDTQFIGLGIPTISASFIETQAWYVFFLKIVFTALTIATGFKGGEVTPLFFIGATLGSALSSIFPLPVGILSGMGFVAVFAGATNTPIACLLMGIELFGSQAAIYIAIAVILAYTFSGHTGIYLNQLIGEPKNHSLKQHKDKTLKDLIK